MSAGSGTPTAEAGTDRRPRGGSAMAVPAFRRLWIAGVVSDAGDWLMFIALPLVVLQLTGSAFGTSIAFLLELAPPVLLAPLVGRLVDRLPGRGVMVAALLAQAGSLLPLLAVHDRSDLPVVYGVIVAQATFATVFEPAKNAMLPTLAIIGLRWGWMMSSTVLVETVFDWPGIGLYAVSSAIAGDFKPVMGVTLIVGLNFMLANLIVDLLYGVLDPRLRRA